MSAPQDDIVVTIEAKGVKLTLSLIDFALDEIQDYNYYTKDDSNYGMGPRRVRLTGVVVDESPAATAVMETVSRQLRRRLRF